MALGQAVYRKHKDPMSANISSIKPPRPAPTCVAFLLILTAVLHSPAQVRKDDMVSRRTVFVLVDESGTLRVDHDGWRREALALLAYALPNGSSVAISGFGNPERRLTLELSSLDDTEAGQTARRRIAERAANLSNDDRYTDLYGAIQQVVSKVASLDKAALRAAPPALILLTDFDADPQPDTAVRESACRSIRESGMELIAVGFGKVNTAAQTYIAACADTLPVATLKNPGDLVETFWKVARRLSRYIRVHTTSLTTSTPVQVTLPEWATEAAVLAFAPDSPVSDWAWNVNGVSPASAGRYFRFCRIPIKKDRRLSIMVTGTHPVRLSVAVRGDAVLSLTSRTPEPWLRGESIPFSVQLIAASSGKVIHEWVSIDEVDRAAWLRTDDQQPLPMELDLARATFSAPMLLPQAGPHHFTSTVLIDGTVWRAEMDATISPFPVQRTDGALRTWAWVPGNAEVKLTTDLGVRAFEALYTTSANLGHARGVARFGPASTTQTVRVRTSSGSLIRDWFRPLDPITGTMQMDIRLQSGQTVGGFETPVVISFTPLWIRLALTAIPAVLLLAVMRGRRLPAWHLIRLDASWKPIPGDVIRLRTHRRRIDLSRHGLPGTSIRRPIVGQTFVQLGQDTAVFVQGNRHLRYNYARKSIRPGDVISRRDPAGAETSYRVERL